MDKMQSGAVDKNKTERNWFGKSSDSQSITIHRLI